VSEHAHTWTLTLHVDTCHSYSSSYSCPCGATRVTIGERDVQRDPYSLIWFLEDCERCSQLAGGAEPKWSDDVFEKDAP